MNSTQFAAWLQPPMPITSMYQRKPLIMGVLNVTPDSFSDGGRFFETNHAIQHAQTMIEQGADIIDIGGESSRPGAQPIDCEEELRRVIPVIEGIRAISDIMISIDTQKAAVMKSAVASGASMINDIYALQGPDALSSAARLNVTVSLMHMQGTTNAMHTNPTYTQPVVEEINDFFNNRISACLDAGIKHSNLILDPGIGFGKSVQHNLNILNQLSAFQRHKLPLLLGVSRKSTIGIITNKPVLERVPAGIATAVFATLQGVNIIRTHDISETKQALDMIDAIKEQGKKHD